MEFFDRSPAFLPRGAAHLQGDQIGRLAAKLGVDYAPALTGFETKQGRQVPVLDGIIVCEEHRQVLDSLFVTCFCGVRIVGPCGTISLVALARCMQRLVFLLSFSFSRD